MLNLFNKHSVSFCKSCLDTQEQNGVVEWKYRHILKIVHSFLIDASMLAYFWIEAAQMVVFTINRLPSSVLSNKTPFEVLFNRLPNYKFIDPLVVLVF